MILSALKNGALNVMEYMVLELCFIVLILDTSGLESKHSGYEERFLLPSVLVLEVQNNPAPEMTVCRYLCSRDSISYHLCFCSLWLPCLGKVCKKGSYCRVLGRKGKLKTVCCPDFKPEEIVNCNKKSTLVTWRKRTPYYKLNFSLGGCETMHYVINQVKVVEIPGYTSLQDCVTCSLYSLCNGPIVTLMDSALTATEQRIELSNVV